MKDFFCNGVQQLEKKSAHHLRKIWSTRSQGSRVHIQIKENYSNWTSWRRTGLQELLGSNELKYRCTEKERMIECVIHFVNFDDQDYCILYFQGMVKVMCWGRLGFSELCWCLLHPFIDWPFALPFWKKLKIENYCTLQDTSWVPLLCTVQPCMGGMAWAGK